MGDSRRRRAGELWRILRANREFTKLFGFSLEESLGRNISELIVPEEFRNESERCREALARGERVDAEVVPDSDRFIIDGREVAVNELKPGTKLTQTITTTTTPHYVTTVRNLKGKVWHVNAPTSLIVSLPGGNNQIFQVPSHAQFTVEGHVKTIFDLRKGMNIEATVVTDSQETVMSHSKSVVGQAPVLAPPEIGVLSFLPPPPPAVAATAGAEEPTETAEVLPDTASLFPLAGLLGSLAVAASLGIATVRLAVAVR